MLLLKYSFPTISFFGSCVNFHKKPGQQFAAPEILGFIGIYTSIRSLSMIAQ